MDIWRPVVGFEDLYEVSSLGRVRRVARWSRNRMGPVWLKAKDIAFNYRHLAGYAGVTLSRNGEKTSHLVHALVAAAFHGLRPEGAETRHLDGNPRNNCALNLQYGTRSENQQDRNLHGSDQHGDRNSQCKLTRDDVECIRWMPGSQRDVAAMFGISQQQVSKIKLGLRRRLA